MLSPRPAPSALAVGAALLLAAATAHAATDTIRSQPNYAYSGASGPGEAFSLDAGSQAILVNEDTGPDGAHNVVSTVEGPDGGKLFKTALLTGGQSAPVDGTQYLEPGTYSFVCTIHAGMAGTLAVGGGTPVARPSIVVSVASSKLAPAQRGKLRVSVKATTAANDASVAAKLGAKPLGSASGIDLAAGESRTIALRLAKPARKSLEDLSKAKIVVAGEVPYGSPVHSSRTLR